MSVSLVSSSTLNLFFSPPKTVFIDEDEETDFASSGKITDLFKDFAQGLPVAYGYFGPSAYAIEPKKLEKQVEKLDVFGWQRGAPRNTTAEKCYAMVLGGKRQKDGDFVFYALSQDVTTTHCLSTRKHEPCSEETRVFAASVKTFYERMVNLYPAKRKVTDFDEKVSAVGFSSSKSPMPLSNVEVLFARQLESISLDSFSEAEMQIKVHILGQKIFEHYKNGTADSREGISAMRKIADSLQFLDKDGLKRMREIESLWEGIGDEYTRWR